MSGRTEYYGHAAGAVLLTDGYQPGAPLRVVCGAVSRPQRVAWTVFAPYPRDCGQLHGDAAHALKARLEKLEGELWAERIDLRQFRDAIDCAVVDATTRP